METLVFKNVTFNKDEIIINRKNKLKFLLITFK